MSYRLKKLVPKRMKEIPLVRRLYYEFPMWRLTIFCKRFLYVICHQIVRRRLRGKSKLSVAFILINSDTWKLDGLYAELKKHKRFNPIIIVAPFVTKGDEFLKEQMNQCVHLCQTRNYKYLTGYDFVNKKSISLNQNNAFDIVFFTNPNLLTSKEYLIENFKTSLTCYVPYSFRIDKQYAYEFNNPFVNFTWMNFWETDYHKKLSESYALNKGKNVRVTGYPQLDLFMKERGDSLRPAARKKKIIWAPHWTIPGLQATGLDWSCFLDFESVFLEIADNWSDDIEIVMKPHPFLFNLLESTCWGNEKVMDYKREWGRRENCSILHGDYTNLFLTSDALIHDSGSFLVEYLALNRPAAYMTKNADSCDKRFNDIGCEAISAHHIIENTTDLMAFTKGIVEGVDYRVHERKLFQDKYTNYNSASKSIVAAMDLNI